MDDLALSLEDWGLSPHARGNRLDERAHVFGCGSIPARAGEPAAWLDAACSCGVYPRTRGGTRLGVFRQNGNWGLSPHARGNRQCRSTVEGRDRSIPARAGEPGRQSRQPVFLGVYPRTRGGTIIAEIRKRVTAGLSPHARGNRRLHGCLWCIRRSIPARAGEPLPNKSLINILCQRACTIYRSDRQPGIYLLLGLRSSIPNP